LTDFVRGVVAKLASDGYAALAVDLLSEEGGTSAVGADATAALGRAPLDRLVGDLKSGVAELGNRQPGRPLAAIGFCFGGGLTWSLLAAGEDRVAAAVPFYGPTPDGADFTKAKAAVLAIYGETDSRVNAGQAAAEAALKSANLTYQIKVYSGVGHAFM